MVKNKVIMFGIVTVLATYIICLIAWNAYVVNSCQTMVVQNAQHWNSCIPAPDINNPLDPTILNNLTPGMPPTMDQFEYSPMEH